MQQRLGQTSIERNIIFRIFRLHIVHSAAHHASLNQYGAILEVEIAPLQPENFANAKAQALCNQYHRSAWIVEVLEQFKELSHVQNPRPLQSFACVFHAHQRDGVLNTVENAPTLCALENQVHDSPHMSL